MADRLVDLILKNIDKDKLLQVQYERRPSQNLCKPPMWCRIEAPHWRFL